MVHVTRSPDAPPSLEKEKQKKNGQYNLPDVTERLNADFHCKCYLCEISPVSDPEVEHLVPKQGGNRPEVKFDWNNLFFSCRHCNGVKNQAKYDGVILDCCREEPEEQLKHTLAEEKTRADGKTVTRSVVKVVPAKRSPTEEAKRTAELITECYELRNTGVRTIACDVRFRALSERMDLLYQTLGKYLEQRRTEKSTARTVRALRGMLDRSAPFAGFTRTYVRQHVKSYPDLKEYVQL